MEDSAETHSYLIFDRFKCNLLQIISRRSKMSGIHRDNSFNSRGGEYFPQQFNRSNSFQRNIPDLDMILNRPFSTISFSEDEILDVLKALIDLGVELQTKKIAHRNIKPQNVMLNRDNSLRDLRLINFELGI